MQRIAEHLDSFGCVSIPVHRVRKMEAFDVLAMLVELLANLRDHIAIKVVGTSTTNENYVKAPFGNAYGSSLTPKNINIGRLKADSPWSNFFWCNASSGYAGFYGTTNTGVAVYSKLSGDTSFLDRKLSSDEELIEYAKERWEENKKKVSE